MTYDLLELAAHLVDRPVLGLRRVFWVDAGGTRDETDGLLEITVAGAVVVLDGGADGASLRWSLGSWKDGLAEPLSPAKRSLIAHGKWTAFDVAAWPEYQSILGDTIVAVEPLTATSPTAVGIGALADDETILGARLITERHLIDALSNSADEFVVHVSPRHG